MIVHKVPNNTKQVKNLLSTSIVDGLAVSTANIVVGVSADIIIGSGVGRFVDNFTDPRKPNYKGDRFFPGVTLETVDISVVPEIFLNEDLSISTEPFDGVDGATERRTRIQLGVVGPTGLLIGVKSLVGFDTQNQVKDATQAYGAVRTSGLMLEPNGVNLSFNRTSGSEFSPFYPNMPLDKKNLSEAVFSSQEPVTFFDTWQDATQPTGFNFSLGNTLLRVGLFDDGDAGAGGPDGITTANRWGIYRVYETFGTFGVLFPQQTYVGSSNAIDALSTETFVQSPLVDQSSFRGYIIARGGATDLSLITDALLFPPVGDFVTTRVN